MHALSRCCPAGSGAYCDIRLGRLAFDPVGRTWCADVTRSLAVDARLGLPGATAVEAVSWTPDGGLALAVSCDVRAFHFGGARVSVCAGGVGMMGW